MHYFPKKLNYYAKACTIAEQVLFSKSKSKKRLIPCMRPVLHPDITHGDEQKVIENTCVEGLAEVIVSTGSVYLKFDKFEEYVETSLVEYAKSVKWCLDHSAKLNELKWVLSSSDRKIIATIYDDKNMAFVPDIQDQALMDELLIATSSKESCPYAWKFGETENDVTFWERNNCISRSTPMAQITANRYLPCTQLDLESKIKLSQGAKLGKLIARLPGASGLGLLSSVMNNIEENYPSLSFNAMLRPKGTELAELVFLFNRHQENHFYYQAQANPLYIGELPDLTYRAMYYLPLSKWQELNSQIENELHPEYQNIWGLPKYFWVDALVEDGAKLKNAQLEITSMPVIENKRITGYTINIKWHDYMPNFKLFTLPAHTRKKNKLTFVVATPQEAQQLIKEHLVIMCSHVKCSITYKDIIDQIAIPWLSYGRDYYTSFAEITSDQKILGDIDQDEIAF